MKYAQFDFDSIMRILSSIVVSLLNIFLIFVHRLLKSAFDSFRVELWDSYFQV